MIPDSSHLGKKKYPKAALKRTNSAGRKRVENEAVTDTNKARSVVIKSSFRLMTM